MTDHRKLDRNVDKLLREAQARVDLVGAREIIRGLLATPVADDDDAMRALIAPKADSDLMDGLRDLRDRIADTFNDDGLSRRKTDPERVAAVRAELKRQNLNGFIVPKADEHQGEFIARYAERLQWMTGFSGSAGSAVIMSGKKAAVFVDGRYTIQVKKQVDTKIFECHHTVETSLYDWLANTLRAGDRLGFDPWLHTDTDRNKLEKICNAASADMVAVTENPVDAAWLGRPPAPLSPVVPHPTKYAGEASAKKRARIAKRIAQQGLDAAILSAPDSIAWLLNIRGRDIPCTPVSLGFAIIRAEGGVEWFTDPRKLTEDAEGHLGDDVIVLEPDALISELSHIGTRGLKVGAPLMQTPSKIAATLRDAGADLIDIVDPTALPKAQKNAAERKGMQAAHLRDGIALVQFLSWIDREAPKGKLSEWDIGAKIDALRTELDLHRGQSFDTIAGFGANGAIVHYRAPDKKSAVLKKGSLLLVDSGGQFLDGTTDVTRTVTIGKPTAEMRDRYTRVLKGHIALACAVFPEGTSGAQLDILARKPLWQVGLDYDHGTGHGVGAYLGVHEGPQRISKHPSTVSLRPGMVVSNEPGYYKTKGFGIRIENLVMVREVKPPKGAERRLLGFENLTCAPYDLRLIEPKLMTRAEVTWINDYHAWVKKSLTSKLDKTSAKWLATATKPIKVSAAGA